jgi:hypothetical protein
LPSFEDLVRARRFIATGDAERSIWVVLVVVKFLDEAK